MARCKSVFVFALVALGVVATSAPAEAGCRGGRCFGGFGGGFGGSLGGYARQAISSAIPHYTRPLQNHAPRYSTPSYGAPSYSTTPAPSAPAFGTPAINQPIQSQIVPTAPGTGQSVTAITGSTGQTITAAPATAAGVGGVQQQSTRPLTPPQQATAPAASTPAASPEQTALQLLAGGNTSAPAPSAGNSAAIPQFQTPQNPNVGSWVASLPGGASVNLDLNNDGTFTWAANNSKGTNSSFQGTYAINSGTLTLTRSSDGGKLSGTMTANGSGGFQFKVAGAAGGLDFTRK